MNKFTLHTRDNVLNLNIDTATIYTDTYSRKLNINEVHTPMAAKLIVESKKTISVFLLPNPIIKIERDGTTSVWTAAPFEKVALKKNFIKNGEELIQLATFSRLLKAKEKIGLTMNEIFELERVNTLLALQKLYVDKAPVEIGGGF